MKNDVKKFIWIAVVAIVLIGGGLTAYYASQGSQGKTVADPKLLVHDDSHSSAKGPFQSKVTLVEFGDYECPACGYTAPIVAKVISEYPQVNFIFRNFPLPMHKNALRAAYAAEAAGEQGKFWEMHDWLYQTQDKWGESDTAMDMFMAEAQTLGLDTAKFKKDVESNKYLDAINRDRNDGVALGIDSTPTFFLNGKINVGAFGYADLKAAIEKELGQSSSTSSNTQTNTITTTGITGGSQQQ